MAPQVPEQPQQQRNDSIIANAASITNESLKSIPTESSVLKKIESKPPQQQPANGPVTRRDFRIFIDGNYANEIFTLPFGNLKPDEKRVRSYALVEESSMGEIEFRGEQRKIALNSSPPSFSRTPNWLSAYFLISRSSASIVFVRAGPSVIDPGPYVNQILQGYKTDGEMDRPIAIILVDDEKYATKMEDARQKAQNVLDSDISYPKNLLRCFEMKNMSDAKGILNAIKWLMEHEAEEEKMLLAVPTPEPTTSFASLWQRLKSLVGL